jgi:hypothetical protein
MAHGGYLQAPDPDAAWEPPTSVVFGSPHIREVALLRTLGFAATSSLGLERANLQQLQTLAATFGWNGTGKRAPGRAFRFVTGLALLGWQLLPPRDGPPPELERLADHFKACHKHLGLDTYGLAVWRPPPERIEQIAFRLRFRDAALVREALASWRKELSPVKSFGDPATAPGGGPAAPANFVEARANLLRLLEEDRRDGGVSEDTRAASRTYEDLLQRDLVRPVLEWARAQRDPVLMNTGVELANVCEMLHRLSPALHDLQARALERGLGRGGGEEPTPALLIQHAQLNARLAALLKALRTWQRAL